MSATVRHNRRMASKLKALINKLKAENKRLLEKLENAEIECDHWRQAYCKAEQETARMDAWATKLWNELQELRNEIQTDQPKV